MKLAHHGTSVGAFDTQTNLHFLVMSLLMAVLFFLGLDLWALGRHDQEGRGWILMLSSLMGFMCFAAVFIVSFPKWKHYFEKPKSGVNNYQTVPPA